MAANTSGNYSVALGYSALTANTSGVQNAAVGSNTMVFNTTGGYNTTLGTTSLFNNQSGSYNTAIGNAALYSNTTASNNTAVGYQSAYSNTTGHDNIAIGYNSQYGSGDGSYNVSVGRGAIYGVSSGSGSYNSALGYLALSSSATGNYNVAVGSNALQSNTTSSNNTAVGYQAGYSQTTFGANTFIGYQAGYTQNNTSSYTYNTFVGYQAGYATTTAVKCTILGGYNGNQGGLDIRTSSNYIVLSDGDGNPRGIFDGSGNFLVGTTSAINSGVSVVTGTNTVQLNLRYSGNASGKYYALGSWSNNGSSFVIQSNTGAGVALASESAQSWSSYSDVRLKNITGKIENALNGIMQLEPIRFSWKRDSENKPQVGISAQSILPIVPEAVDESENFMDLEDKNKYYMVRYTELIPLLTAAIQELKAEFDAYKASHP